MNRRAFFRSKLGRAAMLSVAAMVAMNVAVLHNQVEAEAARTVVADEGTGLA